MGLHLSPAGPVAASHQAVMLAQSDPRRALVVAAMAAGQAAGNAEVTSRAERAMGLAAKELNDLDGAEAHLRRAATVAARAGLTVPEAEARMSLALTLAYRGRTTAALRQADLAAPALTGGEAARLQMQRAIILDRLGRRDEALEGYRRALVVFRQLGDGLWEARLLCNRGVLHCYRSELAAARSDLTRSLALSEALGQQQLVGAACHNLGFVETRAGDVPGALSWYDRAEALWRSLDVPCAVLLLDRCEVLLSVGLYREGRDAAARAVAELEGSSMAIDLAEARLMLAHASLLEGDHAAAGEGAALAERAFVRQRRGSWAVLARHARTRAGWLAGERTPASLAAARRVADELSAAGWAIPALDARLTAGRIALELGRTDVARAELALAGRARRHGPVDVRVRAWHAEGLRRLADGDRRAADRALQAGVRLVHRYRHALGATDLRAHSASHGIELAAAGVRLAVEDGRPERVLAWAERARAGVLLGRPARPPDDDVLVAELAELRHVSGELQAAAVAGRPTARLRHRQVELEEAVRRRARQARSPGPGSGQAGTRTGAGSWPAGPGSRSSAAAGRADRAVGGPEPGEPGEPGEPPDLDALVGQLGHSALIELIDVEGSLHAVVVAAGRTRLVALGPTADAAGEVDSLRFALRRLATGHGAAASQGAARQLFDHAARSLQARLLDPVEAMVDGRPLVLIPTGPLHAIPWAALPGLHRRPVTVAPSAVLWLASASAGGRDTAWAYGAATLVAGPGLVGAPAEIAELAARYTGACVLTGDQATVGAVSAALEGADMAHVAAHGSFRADNPLFSSLTLADGALTVYDLERVAAPPTLMVLSSCDAGLSAVAPGDALMGLAAALLSIGTRTLIASVAPVPDAGAGLLMTSLHAGLAAGLAPAAALAEATAGLDVTDHAMLAVRSAFVCFGAG